MLKLIIGVFFYAKTKNNVVVYLTKIRVDFLQFSKNILVHINNSKVGVFCTITVPSLSIVNVGKENKISDLISYTR